ncbi:MAG: ribonuclease T2 family protein [Sphingomonas sp.]
MRRLLVTIAAALGLMPVAAHAQAYQCAVPTAIPTPRPELPSQSEPRRVLPIGGYTLAIRWTPEFCHMHGQSAESRFECASGNRFGFTLHGLWPDGVGKVWPQYCRDTGLLPHRVIAAHLCANPSVQLTQHEWAKHGTCTSDTPAQFLSRSRRLYARLRYPNMDALSRRGGLTVGQFETALAHANPGLSPNMMRVTANRDGWLEEVWLCLGKDYRYRRCPAFETDLPASKRLKIWRGAR